MIPPIQSNETSFAVMQVHRAMRLLQLPINPKEMAVKKAGASTQKAIRTWQKQRQLAVNPNQLLDTVTINAMTKTLQGMGYLDTKMRHTVSGKVTSSQGGAASKIKLLAFDLDLKGVGFYKKVKFYKQLLAAKEGLEFLGEAVSDAKGFYEVVYYDWMFAKSERKLADIVVFGIQGDAIIGRSRLVQNAPRAAQDVAIVLNEIKRTKGAYKPLYQQVASFLKDNGLKIAELGEEEEYVSFVAGELDLVELQLQYLLSALALNNTVKARLEPELLFGLASQNIPLNWDRLAAFSDEVLHNAMQEAIVQKIIDPFSEKAITDFIDLVQSCALEKTLEPNGDKSNITDDLLKISLGKKQDRVQFLKLKKQFKGTDENEFWDDFLPTNSGFTKETQKSLRNHDTLFKLSGFHPPLVKEISKNQPQQLENLVEWDTDKWTTLIKKSDVPEHIAGKTKKQKIETYALALQNSVNTRFVSAALQHKIKTKQVPVSSTKIGSSVIKFLSKTPEFNIKTSNIREQEATIKTMVGPDEVLQQQVLQEINTFQRLVRINPDTSLLGPMKSHGLTSAMAIAEYPRKTFALQFKAEFGGEQQALALYDAATFRHAESHRIATGIDVYTNRFTPDILRGTIIKPEWFIDKVKERFPGYSEVFDVALCECQHCNSVYGPSAYFVDLMRYLERGVKKEGKSPLDVFQERRPDLFHLPLTCENANTLIPYIDLANEVMENYIFYTKENANPIDAVAQFSAYQSADTANLTVDELRAQPQYIQKETYKKLAQKVYPMHMPFHLPLEILRAYAAQMGTSWHRILKTLHQGESGPAILDRINAAYLDLSPNDADILLDTGTVRLHEYYGYPNASEVKNLYHVPTFLEQTQLKYVELVALLKTRYLNPGLYKISYLDFLFQETELTPKEIYTALDDVSTSTTISSIPVPIKEAVAKTNSIELNAFKKWIEENFEEVKSVLTLHQDDNACSLSNTEILTIKHIYKATATSRYLTNSVLQKLHTFIRLWRKIGWSIQDFDAVVTSFGTTAFDKAFLNKLSYAKQFIDVASLSPKKAAVLWGTMDYRTENSLYAELFLSRTIEIGEPFLPSPGHELFSNLSDSKAEISTFTPILLAAFKISETELLAIYAKEDIAPTNRISIANMSSIYRYVLFASVCQIDVHELVAYIDLFKLTPFAHPKNTLEAYQAIKEIVDSNFEPKTLSYILQSETIPHDHLILEDDKILEHRVLLQEKYTTIDIEDIKIDEDKVITEAGETFEGAKNRMIKETREKLRKGSTYEQLATLLSISPEKVKMVIEPELVSHSSVSAFIGSFSDAAYIEYIKGISRAVVVIDGFKLDETEVNHHMDHKEDFDGLNFGKLNLEAFWYLYEYSELTEGLPQGEEGITSIFKYVTETGTPTRDALSIHLQEATNWGIKNISYLLDEVHTDIAEFKNGKVLFKMSRIMALATTMGIAVESLYKLEKGGDVGSDPDGIFNDFWERAQSMKQLLKAKYDSSTWTKVATKLNDQLRERQRNALVAYCLTLPSIRNHELQVRDANGLYEFFLLDVQMSACMDTSRIVQASAAIQQFVNRSHLNLEKKVKVEALDRGRWQWMQHYRVWEAQMRVWYENETLLNPEWRMDKTPFFKELESYLTQNDITDRTAEEALRIYVRRMDEVSNLNVAGMYEDKENKVVHVFAHTNNTPYGYYYRTYNEFGKWSAWEKVDAAIQAVSHSDADTSNGDKKTGVHLIPVVWKNRLLLFWPEFMEKQEPKENEGKTFQAVAENELISSQEPKKYWEVRLAWSEYFDGKWTPKQVSEEYLTIEYGVRFSHSSPYPHAMAFNSSIDSISEILNVSLTVLPQSNEIQDTDANLSLLPLKAFIITSINEKIHVGTANFIVDSFDGVFSDDFQRPASIMRSNFKNKYLLDRYVYDFQKTKEENEQYKQKQELVFSEIVLKNANKHRLLFSNSLSFNANPVKEIFFYSFSNKNYFVNQKTTYFFQAFVPMGMGHFLDTRFNNNSFNFPILLEFPKPNFQSFHHPFVSNFIQNLNANGIFTDDIEIPGLLDSDLVIEDDRGAYFKDTFDPNFPLVFEPTEKDLRNPNKTFFKETIDFDPNGANSQYNWELFYHAPLYIATQLSKNGQYREAVKWFHYLFDPTTDAPVETGPDVNEIARFFKVKPFKKTDIHSFEEFIRNLEANPIGSEENQRIKEWRENPFNPHLIASSFHVNYMKHLVLAYVENLVNWGDSLFRRFTRENVYEAIQLYVIAGHILGPKPQFIPKRGVIKKETYASIRDKLTDLSNAYVSLENSRPFSSTPSGVERAGEDSSLLGNAPALYFCTPPNKRLLKYWDLVEDRLYKIRNCKDINGIARRLALFAPPIDPAALIKAKSAGLDLDDVIGNLNTPPPHYRFMYLLQKANEFCNDVKALGAAVLSAIEKEEGEALSQLRSVQEVELLGMMQKIRERQVLDAKTAKELLEKQRQTAIFRFAYYNETLLGNDAVEIPPVRDLELDLDGNSIIPVNPDIQEIVPDVNITLHSTEESGLKILSKEKEDLDKRNLSKAIMTFTAVNDLIGSVAALFPNIEGKIQPFGTGVGAGFGGQNIASATQMVSSNMQRLSSIYNQEAALSSTTASYIRREQDWTLQANLAAKEVQQLERQILSAGIRVQIAEKELENHKQQIANAETIENYIRTKFSNKELYQWMKEQLVSVHKQSYDMAFELARKAEMAFEYEKGTLENPIVGYGHFESAKNGLLAGEKLQLALRRLELAYQEKNLRELELTKHISLQLLVPLQLMMLKETGKCSVTLFEELFDLDYPGHYNRRIKSVSLSIPCITGPHTTIACTLRQTSSKVRIQADDSDDAIVERLAPIAKVATSTGQNDSGVYELNFRDERYLPFEGSGVISNWDLELFHDAEAEDHGKSLRQFDYDTIADVILHIRYTAVEEGEFKTKRINALKKYLKGNSTLETEDGTKTLHLLKAFNLKQDFPSDWHKMIHPNNDEGNILNFKIQPDHFPYRDKGQILKVNALHVIARTSDSRIYTINLKRPIQSDTDVLEMNLSLSGAHGSVHSAELDTSSEAIEIDFSSENLWNLEVFAPSGELLTQDELHDLFLVLEYVWKN